MGQAPSQDNALPQMPVFKPEQQVTDFAQDVTVHETATHDAAPRPELEINHNLATCDEKIQDYILLYSQGGVDNTEACRTAYKILHA